MKKEIQEEIDNKIREEIRNGDMEDLGNRETSKEEAQRIKDENIEPEEKLCLGCNTLPINNPFHTCKEKPPKIEDWEKEFRLKFGGIKDKIAVNLNGEVYLMGKLNDAVEFIRQQKQQYRQKIEKTIKLRLKYCQEQNGLPYCKNCGLCEEDLEKLNSKN